MIPAARSRSNAGVPGPIRPRLGVIQIRVVRRAAPVHIHSPVVGTPMKKRPNVSAGLLLFRRVGGRLEVLLAHPGGPFWAGKDAGAWTIPKGLAEPGEDLLAAARRAFAAETGPPPE